MAHDIVLTEAQKAQQSTEPVMVVELAAPTHVPRTPESQARSLDRVADALREDPHSFSFFQAVRLLEKLYPGRLRVGALDDPAREVVRFKANPTLSFPASEIQQLTLDDEPPTMVVNFMGLIGPQAVLPHQYTLLVAERLRARDPALADFLDIFQHRLVSLFYQAWRKQRIAIAREDGAQDPLAEHLGDAIGLGLSTVRNRLPFPDEALVHRAGLLTGMPRGAIALQQLIEEIFDVPADVQQFIGSWYTLDSDDLCALGADDALTNQLGLGAVAGDEIWDQQSRVRIRIGPVERSTYDDFLPGRPAYRSLASLVRFFSHDQFDFELQLVLARDDVAGIRLGEAGAEYQLGWSTWICSAPRVEDADETILTLRTGAAL
jgi:type VI secretion system protein ImpH